MSTTITFGPEQPLYDPSSIQQSYMDTCAIKSQELILNTFGKSVNEDQLRAEAEAMGIYRENYGTHPNHMGDLLELHGVHVASFDEANQYTLMHELAKGHQVIVSLDAHELWTPGIWERLMDFLGFSGANHALVVSHIDTSNPDDIRVCVADPGTGELKDYPYSQFADAWADSHFHMVATTTAPLDSPSLMNFDAENGIMGEIMGLPWNDWMNQFGDMVHSGVELAGQFADFLEEHPAVVELALTTLPMMLDNGIAEGMLDESFNVDC